VICSAQPRNVALDYTRRAMRSDGRAPLARRLYTRESGAMIVVIDRQRQRSAAGNRFRRRFRLFEAHLLVSLSFSERLGRSVL
jgi:hypothetical protein